VRLVLRATNARPARDLPLSSHASAAHRNVLTPNVVESAKVDLTLSRGLAVRGEAAKDEIDEIDLVTGPNSTLFRLLERQATIPGPVPWHFGIRVKGGLGNLEMAGPLRPFGRLETDVATDLPSEVTGHLKWLDGMHQGTESRTLQVWGLQATRPFHRPSVLFRVRRCRLR
jgi:hypothetical protein